MYKILVSIIRESKNLAIFIIDKLRRQHRVEGAGGGGLQALFLPHF